MSPLVGIIAPLTDKDFQSDFVLRLKNNLELSIKNISDLIKVNFNFSKITNSNSFGINDAAAAGYYLSGFLRFNDYNTFLISDCNETSINNLERLSPYAICISTTMISGRKSLQNIVNKIRKKMPDVFIIVGGVLVWKSFLWYNLSQQWLCKKIMDKNEFKLYRSFFIFPCNKSEIDVNVFVVSSHGSSILLQVLGQIVKNKNSNYEGIPNLAIPQKKGEFIFTKRDNENVNYNNDYTRWDLVDNLPARLPIRSSIGCLHKCEYCDFRNIYPKLFLRSDKSLLDELAIIKKTIVNKRHSLVNLFFTDDNVFSNMERINLICKTLIKSKINKTWAGFVRSDKINKSNIDIIKSSGFSFGIVGVESGHPEQLSRMKKKSQVENIKSGIELLEEYAIPTLMTFICGFPGENEETINETISFINNINQKVGFLSYQIYPLFVTPLSSLAQPERRIKWKLKGLGNKWSHTTMNNNIARDYILKIYREVNDISYHYPNESYFYLKQFNVNIIKELVNLRKKLTLKLLEEASWNSIEKIFFSINKIFGYPNNIPSEYFRNEIVIPQV